MSPNFASEAAVGAEIPTLKLPSVRLPSGEDLLQRLGIERGFIGNGLDVIHGGTRLGPVQSAMVCLDKKGGDAMLAWLDVLEQIHPVIVEFHHLDARPSLGARARPR